MLLWLLLSDMLILLMLNRVWTAVKRLERHAHIEHLVLVVDMADENKTERIQLLMTPSEVKAIDDWSFQNRIRGRAEAIRRLCQVGIFLDRNSSDLVHNIQKPVDFDGSAELVLRLMQSLLVARTLISAAELGIKEVFLANEAQILSQEMSKNDDFREKMMEFSQKVLKMISEDKDQRQI